MRKPLTFITASFIVLILFSSSIAQVPNVHGIIFNEVYYDAGTSLTNGSNWNGGLTGDATDEFIEFYNTSDSSVNIRNWVIGDGNSWYLKFSNTDRIINSQQSFILCKDQGIYIPPTGQLVFDADLVGQLAGTFGGGNSGDCFFLVNTGLDTVVGGGDDIWVTFRYGGFAEATVIGSNGGTPNGVNNGTEGFSLDVTDQSIVRNPDITGLTIIGHLAANSELACSPNNFVDGTTPLPVELTSFTAFITENGIELNWQTATETNNFGFEIERSENNSDNLNGWTKIGFKEGNGNSNSLKHYSFIDNNVNSNAKYSYRLKQIDVDGLFEYSKVVEVSSEILNGFELSQNYPNPFNPATTISFTLLQPGNIKLKLFSPLGEELKILAEGFKESGVHSIQINVADLNSGIYIYSLETEGKAITKKMMLLK